MIRLLLALRDPGVSTLFQRALTLYGFEVLVAADGVAASQAFHTVRFDVVCFDAWLGKKDGIALARELRTLLEGRNVGICLLNSGVVSPTARDEALRRANVDAWLDLPVTPAELRRVLAALAHRYTGAVADSMPLPEVTPRHTLREESRRLQNKTAPQTPPTPPTTQTPQTPQTSSSSSSPAQAAPKPVAPKETLVERLSRGRALSAPAAHLILALCRARATGILVLRRRTAEARVAVLGGVVVGATDNGHDNRLGPRLLRRGKLSEDDAARITAWRQKNNGRIGEAILSLGLLQASVLLDELQEQSRAQIGQACGWTEGDALFVVDEPQLLGLAIAAYDVVDIVLSSQLQHVDDEAVAAFFDQRGGQTLTTTLDFEDGLLAYARHAPRSALPATLMAALATSSPTPNSLLSSPATPKKEAQAHLYAMWCAGLVRLSGDEVSDERPVPRPFRPDDVAGPAGARLVDAGAVERVQRAWLRVHGRDPRDVLRDGLPPLLSGAPLLEALTRAADALDTDVGPVALAGKNIGPASAAARDLAVFLEDARAWLKEGAPDAGPPPPAPAPSTQARVHDELRRGRAALDRGAHADAAAIFDAALAVAPDDAEVMAWLGWARFLDAAERLGDAVALIRRARFENPQASRPLLFLAHVAAQQGEPHEADRHLKEALRRCPDDPDVHAAIEALAPSD